MAESTPAVPEWMLQGSAGAGLGGAGKQRRASVVQRTIQGLSRALRRSVFSEQIAARDGLLQGIDPRAKTAGMLGLLIVAAFVRHWYVLLALYGVTLAMAGLSRISLAFFIRRVWLFIPVFTGIIVLPSLFNVFRAGDPLWTIWDFGREAHFGPWSLGSSLAITKQGIEGAVVLVLRVAVSVSLAVLLALTTRWADLLKSLRVFFVPRIFILILSMTYRYIFLLISLASDMFTARVSRMVRASTPREDRRFAAASMGTLLGKSHTMSDEIYAAMVSRGYNGEPMSTHRFSMRGADWVWLGAVALVAMFAAGGDRLLG
ncbi:MAG: cobalt ECF transporter T component CbiQ [Thermoleophilia bacterium]